MLHQAQQALLELAVGTREPAITLTAMHLSGQLPISYLTLALGRAREIHGKAALGTSSPDQPIQEMSGRRPRLLRTTTSI